MILFLFTLLAGLIVAPAQAFNITQPDSPSSFYQQDEEARVEFIAKVNQDQQLDEKTKAALVALVSPSRELSGDAVHEQLDENLLRWFYGDLNEEVASGETSDLIHKTRQLDQKEDLKSCKKKNLCVYISKRHQLLTAYEKGKPIPGLTNQKVSTARAGHYTPTGTFSVGEIADADRVSNLYEGAALYYAMQIDGNIFIHATSKNNYKYLGKPASAGCIRTHFNVAQQLNALMRKYGSLGFNLFGGSQDRPKIRVIVSES